MSGGEIAAGPGMVAFGVAADGSCGPGVGTGSFIRAYCRLATRRGILVECRRRRVVAHSSGKCLASTQPSSTEYSKG